MENLIKVEAKSMEGKDFLERTFEKIDVISKEDLLLQKSVLEARLTEVNSLLSNFK